jgi:hypothetical protein
MPAGKTKHTRSETYIDPDFEKVAVSMTVTMPAVWSDGAQEAVRIICDHGVESIEEIVSDMHKQRQPGLFPNQGPTAMRAPASPER